MNPQLALTAPPPPPHFTGREQIIDEIMPALRAGEATAITALAGMGGIRFILRRLPEKPAEAPPQHSQLQCWYIRLRTVQLVQHAGDNLRRCQVGMRSCTPG
jgi:hypothetical protein